MAAWVLITCLNYLYAVLGTKVSLWSATTLPFVRSEMCGASVGGSLLATGGKQDSNPARDPEMGTSWLFSQGCRFPKKSKLSL